MRGESFIKLKRAGSAGTFLISFAFVFLVWTSVVSAQVAELQSCRCLKSDEAGYQPGIVWKGRGEQIRLKDIAAMLAPALWFSSKEPLVIKQNLPIPRSHPCDTSSSKPVVYYQARQIDLRGDEAVTTPEEDDPDFFRKVDNFSLRYFFYYPADYGMHAHLHDLETAEMKVHLEHTPAGCDQVRVSQVTGFAHGLDWYSNRSKIEPDTKFPLMLLIERGKHATCPDRNADGIYVRGYDVNVDTNDAWGIRDGWKASSVFRSILLFGIGQRPADREIRTASYRVVPPDSPGRCISEQRSSWMDSDSIYMDRYELRPANQVLACETDHPGRPLYGMMKENRFGSAFPLVQNKSVSLHEPVERMSYTGFPPLSLRLDGDLGVSFVLPGWKYRAGYYVLPKINLYGRESSLEALVTPNASQFFSWYATVGVDQTNFEEVSFVDEIGIKVRFPIQGTARKFLSLNYRFAGVRVGIRNKGFRHPDSQILIEVGAGVW